MSTLKQLGSTQVTILLIFGLILLAGACSQPAAKMDPSNNHGVFLIINNSGSTNSPGFTITVNNNGSGTLIYKKCGYASTRPQCQIPNKMFPSQTFQLNTVRQILSRIGLIQNIPNHYCAKSASFGSVTTIVYNGQTSGDISCIDSFDPQDYQDLKNQIDAFIRQAVQ